MNDNESKQSPTPKIAPAAPLRPDERINEFSAQSDEGSGGPVGEDIEYGTMNESDARASGYIGPNGRAVETAKQHDGTRLGTSENEL